MELSDALIQNLFGLGAGLIGAIVGGLFTVYAAYKTIRSEEEKEDRQEQQEVLNLLGAMGVELGTLWNFHMKRTGGLVEQLPDNKPFAFYYPLTQDYFTVYDSNAHMLGKIPDKELRTLIVTTYNKCKKVVDGFKYNNQLYRDYRELTLMDDKSEMHAERLQKKYNEMCDYAKIVKEDHYELKGYMEALQQGLHKIAVV